MVVLRVTNRNKAELVLGVFLVLALMACVSTPYKNFHPQQLTDDQLVQELSDVYRQLNVSTASLQMLRQAMLPPAYRVDSTSFTNIYLYTTLIGNTAYTTGTAYTTTNYSVTDENQLANSMNQLGQTIQRSRITTLLQRGQALEYEVVRRVNERNQPAPAASIASPAASLLEPRPPGSSEIVQPRYRSGPSTFKPEGKWRGNVKLGSRTVDVDGWFSYESESPLGRFRSTSSGDLRFTTVFPTPSAAFESVAGTITFASVGALTDEGAGLIGRDLNATVVTHASSVHITFPTLADGETDGELWLYPEDE